MTDAPLDTSIVDLPTLRAERLASLQAAMRSAGADVALFFMPGNIRYATGTAIMTVYSMSASVRCALVPAEGTPIVFEHAESAHVSARIAPDVRPFAPWEYFDDLEARAGRWADEIVAAIAEVGAAGSTLFVDKLATPALLALIERGVRFADVGTVSMDAREVKTPQELRAFQVNAELGMRLMGAVEAAVQPGVREAPAGLEQPPPDGLGQRHRQPLGAPVAPEGGGLLRRLFRTAGAHSRSSLTTWLARTAEASSIRTATAHTDHRQPATRPIEINP